jgi:hypothetical protein
MDEAKLTVRSNVAEQAVAYDPECVVAAVWSDNHTNLHLWFAGVTQAVTLNAKIAQAAWEELAGLKRRA